MTQHPPFAPQPSRPPRGVIPFPIIGPGCCGCGFVATALIAVAALGGGLALQDPAPEASGPGSSVVQEHPAF